MNDTELEQLRAKVARVEALAAAMGTIAGEADRQERAAITSMERLGWHRVREFNDMHADQIRGALADPAPVEQHDDEAKPTDCPHAAPFVYCNGCKVTPCPLGLGGA